MNFSIFILSLLSALLYVLSSPSIDMEPLGWIAIAPLLFAIDKCRSKKTAFLAGTLGGLAAYSGLCYWFIGTMINYGGMSFIVSFFFFLFLALYMALYWGVFAWGLKYLLMNRSSSLFAAPLLWVTLEYIRTYLFTGHPWTLLGYTQYKSNLIIQIADIFGVYGVSFILVLFSAALFEALKKYGEKKSIPYKEGVLLLLTLAIPLTYGAVKVSSYKLPEPNVSVALIQGNIDQGLKWKKDYKDETINIYRILSEKALKEAGTLDIIVWPETAAPFYFQQPGSLRSALTDISKTLKTPLLFGSPAYSYEKAKIHYLNSAFLISPREKYNSVETLGRYDKIHLVPFGEYVPLKNVLSFMDKITPGIGEFSPGEGVMTLKTGSRAGASEEIAYGPLICYEIIFPNLVRELVNKGAHILVNITNDAWYGRSSAPYQHLSAAIFRSVENNVYTIRAANTGVTAIINPLGKIEGVTEIFETTFLTGKAGITDLKTFYTKYGDIFAIAASFMTLVAFLSAAFKCRNNSDL